MSNLLRGGGSVLFNKPSVKKEVLNDLNTELIEFYKKIKGKKFCCSSQIHSKDDYNRLKNKKSKTTCEYVNVNKASYGGLGTGYSYTARKGEYCFDASRLRKVTLTNKDFRQVIKKYDSKNTVFYVDPPYVRANQKSCLYGKNLCKVTPEDVASTLKKIKGKAIVSYDDHPKVRKAFKDWKHKKVELPYGFKKGKTKELLIRNY